MSSSSLNVEPNMNDQTIPNENAIAELTEYFKNLIDKQKRELKELVRDHPWFIISFQSFCKCDSNTVRGKKYTPYWVLAEVGLIEYSISEGIVNQYHAFLKPNTAPIGYRSKCKDEEKEGHKIPYDSFDKAIEVSAVCNDIKNFMINNANSKDPFAVFCLNRDIEQTKFALEFLIDEQDKKEDCFKVPRVFSVENLLIYMASVVKFEISSYSATNILTAYTYDYTPTARCEYHEQEDVTKCAIGCCKRYSFLISDYICQHFGIKLTEQHLPKEKAVAVQVFSDSFKNNKLLSRQSVRNRNSSQRVYSTYSNNYRATEPKTNENEIAQEDSEEEFFGESMNDDESTFSSATEMASSTISRTSYTSKSERMYSAPKSIISHEQNSRLKVGDRFDQVSRSNASTISSIKIEKTNYYNESDDEPEWQDLRPRTIIQPDENDDTLSNVTGFSKHTIMSASSASRENTNKMGNATNLYKQSKN